MAKRKKPQNSKKTFAYTLCILLCVTIAGVFGLQLPDNVVSELPAPLAELFSNQKTAPKATNSAGTLDITKEIIDNGSAHFSTKEMSTEKGAWIVYGELDSLGRATGAEALLDKSLIGTGTSANANIRPVGFISGLAPYYHSRGHLIGRQLGGTGDDERNLATLYQNPVNTPNMSGYENKIRAALEQGEVVRYRVTPLYNDEQLMCEAIRLEAKGITTETVIDFDVTLINLPNKKEE